VGGKKKKEKKMKRGEDVIKEEEVSGRTRSGTGIRRFISLI